MPSGSRQPSQKGVADGYAAASPQQELGGTPMRGKNDAATIVSDTSAPSGQEAPR